jgi:short subunit dehydrogenase-like uncharacterized protein
VNNGKIVVFGASGHTGRFVVAELARRGKTAILAGRDPEKLLAVQRAYPSHEVRVASVADPASLDQALAGASLVINCAGPFVDTAEPLMQAALRARIHYLDVTSEQSVVLAAFEKYSNAARAVGILLMPAMAFYGAMGDLLATAAMGDWPEADEIQIAVALDSWKPTQGTLRTGERKPLRRVFTNNALSLLQDPPPKRQWSFPPPFATQEVVEVPLAETVVISRHLRAPEIHAYITSAPLADLHNPNPSGPVAADERGRSTQQFLIEAKVRKGREECRAQASGRDIYAVTAPLIVEAAERLLAGSVQSPGAAAPAQIFNAQSFLRALSPEHFSFTLADSGTN